MTCESISCLTFLIRLGGLKSNILLKDDLSLFLYLYQKINFQEFHQFIINPDNLFLIEF